jgi:ubiquinone/menaquinone biosynthesis C-methylase UbiE
LDAVIANHMLYHVPDRPKAIAEIYRVLKPGGYLFAATNGENHLSELDDLYNELQPELRHTIDRNFSANAFTLENGPDQLTPWFTVDIRYYEDALEVTEVDPLIAYLKSMIPFEEFQVSQEQLNTLYIFLEKRIKTDGCFHITKSTGIFVARKNSA